MFVSVSFCRQDFMVVAQQVNPKREFMENSVKETRQEKAKESSV